MFLLNKLFTGAIVWLAAILIIGPTAAPGSRLFRLVVLVIAADFGGFLVSLTTLPRLIGMLIVGILFQNLGWVEISGELIVVTAEVRKFALVIILIRAGLEMDPEAFQKVYVSILKLGLVPWLTEFAIMAVLTHYIVGLDWLMALCLGAIFAAVSPAVVVPCLFRLRTKGYGVAKGIPTLIVSIAGIDDAASVALFGIFSSILFGAGSLTTQLAQGPICIIGGLGFGVLWGYMMRIVPEKNDPYVIPIRTILLFSGGMLAIFGSEHLGYEGAGPLGVVFAAFVSNFFWCKQGWTVEDNPVGTAFEIFWMFFEPALFGITGAAVKIDELDAEIFYTGAAIIAAAVVVRMVVTIGISFGDGFNLKEKVFVAFACMAKATVQAALGPVTLRKIHSQGTATEEQIHQAEIILMYCILSIILTAPLGAIIITLSGPKLLTKTKPLNIEQGKISFQTNRKQKPNEEKKKFQLKIFMMNIFLILPSFFFLNKKQKITATGWRRSHRPSLYDISIIDEQEEREDPEIPSEHDGKTAANTSTNASKPVYTITK